MDNTKEIKEILYKYCFGILEKETLLRSYLIDDTTYKNTDYDCYFNAIFSESSLVNEVYLDNYHGLYSIAVNTLASNCPLLNKNDKNLMLFLSTMYIDKEDYIIFKDNSIYDILLDRISNIFDKLKEGRNIE